VDCPSREYIPGSHQDGRDTPCVQFHRFRSLVLTRPGVSAKSGFADFPLFRAVAIGISMALLIKPGQYIDSEMVSRVTQGTQLAKVQVESDQLHIADRIVALIPSNYVRAALEQDMLATVVLAIIIGLALTTARSTQRGCCSTCFKPFRRFP